MQEADLFFCFNIVISEVRDSFVRTLDAEDSGINGKVREFDYLLYSIDPQLHEHLQSNGLDP